MKALVVALAALSPCTRVVSADNDSASLHVYWEWDGERHDFSSYPYVGKELEEKKTVASIGNIWTSASWSYYDGDARANVTYDMLTAADQGHDTSSGDFGLIIWLARAGEVYPIGDSVSLAYLDGIECEIFDGFNGDMHVFSYVAPLEQPIRDSQGDLRVFFDHITDNNSFPADEQHLLIQWIDVWEENSTNDEHAVLQFGTEPFLGNPAIFTVSD
ncbi:Endoglucanase-like protein [Hapsidospora chrysogenum ATCC 11550]|uniref:Endoglucanase-like protein n=1 Tax=Hapsidospora chrysogenum (strain ATCC 11550 / CBS 779.69 / DSM 880 / IAM 14645 / JCM 23072 / IMI 49137) TaxID=857340 RepID=A0A086T771_HAPC1|nr:Endoglucanase-like protein [Hapsidospora chrysogenum ATCC 11550]